MEKHKRLARTLLVSTPGAAEAAAISVCVISRANTTRFRQLAAAATSALLAMQVWVLK